MSKLSLAERREVMLAARYKKLEDRKQMYIGSPEFFWNNEKFILSGETTVYIRKKEVTGFYYHRYKNDKFSGLELVILGFDGSNTYPTTSEFGQRGWYFFGTEEQAFKQAEHFKEKKYKKYLKEMCQYE